MKYNKYHFKTKNEWLSKQTKTIDTQLYQVKMPIEEEKNPEWYLTWSDKWRYPKPVDLSIHGIK